jgi:septum formation inhibitor MinC
MNSELEEFSAELNEAYSSWRNAIMAGNGAAVAQTRVDDVLRRWRAWTNGLERQTEAAIAQDGMMQRLSDLMTEAEEQRSVLARLQSEAGTRTDQADSLNPKVRSSPYTNIMGLQRTFRSGTRTVILILAVVFAVLAAAVLGFLVWRVVTEGSVVRAGAMVGGAAATKKVRFADD